MPASFPAPLTWVRLYERVAEQISAWIAKHGCEPARNCRELQPPTACSSRG